MDERDIVGIANRLIDSSISLEKKRGWSRLYLHHAGITGESSDADHKSALETLIYNLGSKVLRSYFLLTAASVKGGRNAYMGCYTASPKQLTRTML